MQLPKNQAHVHEQFTILSCYSLPKGCNRAQAIPKMIISHDCLDWCKVPPLSSPHPLTHLISPCNKSLLSFSLYLSSLSTCRENLILTLKNRNKSGFRPPSHHQKSTPAVGGRTQPLTCSWGRVAAADTRRELHHDTQTGRHIHTPLHSTPAEGLINCRNRTPRLIEHPSKAQHSKETIHSSPTPPNPKQTNDLLTHPNTAPNPPRFYASPVSRATI